MLDTFVQILRSRCSRLGARGRRSPLPGPGPGEWIDVTDLKPGTWLRTGAGTHVQVTAVKRRTAQSATVIHNLTVEGLHT